MMRYKCRPYMSLVWAILLGLAGVGVSGCATSMKVTPHQMKPGVSLGDVEAAIPYRFRKTQIDLTMDFNVYREDLIKRDGGGKGTNAVLRTTYKMVPALEPTSMTIAATYPADPTMTFDILLGDDSLSGGDIKEFTVGFNTFGSITSVNFQSTGRAAEITSDVIETTITLAKLGAAIGLFAGTEAVVSSDEFTTATKLEPGITLRRSLFVSNFALATKVGDLYIATKRLDDEIDGLIDVFRQTHAITSAVEKTFGSVSVKIKSPTPQLEATTPAQLIGKKSAKVDKAEQIEGLPMQFPGVAAIEVSVQNPDDPDEMLNVISKSFNMPEFGSYYFIPVRAGPWVDKTVLANIGDSGAVSSFTYKQPSSAAKVVDTINTSSATLSTGVTNVIGQVKQREQEKESKKLAIATQKFEIRKLEIAIDRAKASASIAEDPAEKARLEDEAEAKEAQLELERVKLQILEAGFNAE